jgi:carboxyl-terminal processing protease
MKRKGISVVAVVIIGILCFTSGFFFNKALLASSLSFEQIRAIDRAIKLTENYSIYDQNIDHSVHFALKGIAASLGDDYAYYYTPEELTVFNDSVAGVVKGGIGIGIVNDGGKCIVTEVYKGLTASEAGILPGDEIIMVDDVKITNDNFSDITRLVQESDNNDVKLTVLRGGKELAYNIKLSDGQRQMTEYKMIEGTKILYVKLIGFRGNVVEYFKEAIKLGDENGYESILMDLRENSGGELDKFAEIADILLPQGTVFYAMDKNGNKSSVKESDANSLNKPICVLINGSSASASEAMAGALRDLGNATLVGTKSYGKGIMQTSFLLNNGGMFKLTTGKYYLPNGDCIHGEGITPHHVVELSDELTEKYWLRNSDNDLQLKKAIEILTK